MIGYKTKVELNQGENIFSPWEKTFVLKKMKDYVDTDLVFKSFKRLFVIWDVPSLVCLAPPTLTYFMRRLKSTTRGYVIHPSRRVCGVTHDEHVDDSRLQKLSCRQLRTQTEMESIFAKNGSETPEPVAAEVRGEFKTRTK